jgi:Flp pilus assembly protein TadB
MAENELEKEIKQIKKDLENINKKIDLVIDELRKKNSDSEKHAGLKDSYQLFFAVILGALGAELLHPIFELTLLNQFPWIFGMYVFVIVTLLIVLSFIGGYLPRWIAKIKK